MFIYLGLSASLPATVAYTAAGMLFVVFIAAILGRSLINVILIFGITDSPIFARVTRGEVLRMGPAPYLSDAQLVEAVTMLGEVVAEI